MAPYLEQSAAFTLASIYFLAKLHLQAVILIHSFLDPSISYVNQSTSFTVPSIPSAVELDLQVVCPIVGSNHCRGHDFLLKSFRCHSKPWTYLMAMLHLQLVILFSRPPISSASSSSCKTKQCFGGAFDACGVQVSGRMSSKPIDTPLDVMLGCGLLLVLLRCA